MKAAALRLLVLLFTITIYSYADGNIDGDKHEEGQEAAADGAAEEGARSRTSPNFDEATRKIQEMVKRDTDKFSKLAEEYAVKIKKGMNNGKIADVLRTMMTEHDTWTSEDEEAIFVEEMEYGTADENGKKKTAKVNRFKNLSEEEKWLISRDYTKERQKLRALLHDKVAEILAKDTKDLRIQALKPELANIKKVNLAAWDQGLTRINTVYKKERKGSPICFTCGEQVSDDPDYEFATKMGEEVDRALLAAGLSNGDVNAKAYFDSGKFSRTKGGTLVKALIDGNGAMLASTGENSLQEQQELGKDRDLVAAARKVYTDGLAKNGFSLEKAYPGNPGAQNTVRNFINWADNNVLNKAAAPVLAAVGGVKPPALDTPTGKLDAYLAKVQGHPSAADYPTAEKMAAAIGLVDADGKPYLEWKGDGRHQDGSSEYGVRMLWDKIRYAEPAERARVMAILHKIASDPGPGRYKVDNNKPGVGASGFCIWCNIRNDSTSKSNMASIK